MNFELSGPAGNFEKKVLLSDRLSLHIMKSVRFCFFDTGISVRKTR